MSNINPLFILVVGATILSLVLVTDSIYAFAQEEEDKDEEKDEKDKDEEKEEESKDKEEEDEEKEESKDEDAENSNNDTAATQIIQDQLTPPPPINNDTTTTVTTFQEPESIAMTPTPTPTEEEEGEFNATCQCKTTSSKKPKPPSNDPITSEQTIIPITSANIKDSKSFGQVTDPAYTSFYTVPNLLDTIIDDISFWSQAGQSSFYIHLDDTLDNYQVCSAELNIHNPKSTPYLLDVGVSKNYSGVIDQTKERIQFEKCVKNMDEIYMTFDNEAGNYISISEIKLFGSKLTGAATQTTIPPTLQPPLIPNEEETENATKINIENSNAEIDIKNSTVTFKFDPMTATFVQQGGGQ